jgi:hypothetical protein
MPSLDSSYRVNEPDVVAESVGGEVLIINLKSGVYYSSDGSGDQIWGLLAQSLPLRDVVVALSGRYSVADGEIESAVLAFAEELEREELLVGAPAAPGSTQTGAESAKAAFVAPVLNRYTDFQELLMLDPIHEVENAAGWPVAKPTEQNRSA